MGFTIYDLRFTIADWGLRLPDGDSWQGLGMWDVGFRMSD